MALDFQTIGAVLIVVLAAWFVGRDIWTQIIGVLRSSSTGGKSCGSRCNCGSEKTPPTLPPHIEAMRKAQKLHQHGE